MKDKNLKIFLLLLPTILIIGGIFFVGLYKGFLISLGYFPEVGLNEFSLKYYKELLSNVDFIKSFKFSLYIAFISAFISTLIGVYIAYLLVVYKNEKSIFHLIYKLPIILPYTIGSLLIINLFSQTGLISRILYGIGLINDSNIFPHLIYDQMGIGIILSYIWKQIPFVILVVYGILNKVNEKLSHVALNLGANKRQLFIHVLLPLCRYSIISAFIIIFAYSFGAFEVPFLIGPTNIRTLPVKAYIEYINPDLTHRPYSMVINMCLSALSFILVLIYLWVLKKINIYEEGN